MDDEQVDQDLAGGERDSSTPASPPTSYNRSKDVGGSVGLGTPERLENESIDATSSGGTSPALDAAALKRIEAAEQRAAQAEAYARTVQASKDRENALVRRETKERLARERAATVALLKSTGVDPAQLDAFERQRLLEDETEDLRYKAAAYDSLAMQEQARQARARYVTAQCAQLGIDPNDRRLDLSSPEAFALSASRIVKHNARGETNDEASDASEEEEDVASMRNGRDRGGRNARQDLDVLGGGGMAANNSECEFRKQMKELRGSGQVAEAMRLIREHEKQVKR